MKAIIVAGTIDEDGRVTLGPRLEVIEYQPTNYQQSRPVAESDSDGARAEL